MYSSPEQALGLAVDARSDLFSLGSVLYECITGKPPFLGDNSIEISARVIRDDPRPPSQLNPDVSNELDRITLKALAKQQQERYQTAEELIADLDRLQTDMRGVAAGQPVTRLIAAAAATQPNSTLATLSEIFKRPRLSIGYVAAGVALLSLIAFVSWNMTRTAVYEPSPEAQQIYDKGVIALHDGAYYLASKLFARAVTVDEKFALAHARLAETFTELDYLDKASNEMLIATRLVSDRAMFSDSDKIYFDAISATVTRDLPAAINSYAAIVKLQAESPSALMDLGRAYENHDDIGHAIEHYSKASNLDKRSPAAHLRLAVLYGPRPDDPDCSLRVLKCARGLGCDVATTIFVPVVIAFGNAILEQDAGHALGCHPVTYFSAFKIHRQKLESTTREDHHRRTGIRALGRKDRHGWRGYVIDNGVRTTRDDVRSFCQLNSLRRLGNTFHIWRTVRPDRDLF
jgi:tetratricopeptide (TPR) repeat protein